MDLRKFLAWMTRVVLVNKKETLFCLVILILVKLGLTFFLRRDTSPTAVVDTQFLNENAFNVKLNPDLAVSTETYLIDYNQTQAKWARVKNQQSEFKKRRELTRGFQPRSGAEFVILEYTKVGGQERFCPFFRTTSSEAETKNKLFVAECPFKNCRFTCDKDDKSLANDADVFLFHESDLKSEMNEANYWPALRERSKNRASQIWLLWNDEANPVSDSLDAFVFNWTMSFRIEAEISDCSYGCSYSMISRSQPNEDVDNDAFEKSLRLEFQRRGNSAVWFVSNCGPQLRLKFALSLRNHFSLKLAGKCFTSLGEASRNFFSGLLPGQNTAACERYSNCEKVEFDRNKFYLSFESKNCSGYITEKFWRILSTGMIPVVLQPARHFYELVAPPDSFIHAQDFNYDPQKLGDYLTKVSNDFELYKKYLAWKRRFNVVYSQAQCERRRLCELCSKLNQVREEVFYSSVSRWFAQDCVVN